MVRLLACSRGISYLTTQILTRSHLACNWAAFLQSEEQPADVGCSAR